MSAILFRSQAIHQSSLHIRKLLLIAGISLLALKDLAVQAQLLSADSQGQSAILFDANAINIDVAATALSINFNNFQSQSVAKQSQLLWGVSASGKNSEGISNLLSDGKFLPTGKLRAFVGVVIRTPSQDFRIHREIEALQKSETFRKHDSLSNVKAIIEDVWKQQQQTIHFSKRKDLRDEINKAIKGRELEEALKNLGAVDSTISKWSSILPDPPIADIKKAAIQLVNRVRHRIQTNISLIWKTPKRGKSLEQLYFEEDSVLQEKHARETKIRDATTRQKIAPYASFGLNGSQIKLYDEKASGSLAKRFVKTPFTGAFLDVGINLNLGSRSLLGTSVGFEQTATLDSLTSTEYTIRTIDPVGNQQLISEKTETGYTGNYLTYTRYNIRFDALHFFRIGEEGNLVWNLPYARWFVTDNQKAAVNLINLGSAVNFYKEKGKFAGGIYLELGDVTDAQYKYQVDIASTDAARLELAKNKTSLWQRLTFGVVAKFAFQTIINPQNW